MRDLRIETYVASVPNPPWEVRVVHVPTGRVLTACGRGYGYRRAAEELARELVEASARATGDLRVDGGQRHG